MRIQGKQTIREFFAESFADYVQNGKKANKVSVAFIKYWLKAKKF
jgi:hypothetical protein